MTFTQPRYILASLVFLCTGAAACDGGWPIDQLGNDLKGASAPSGDKPATTAPDKPAPDGTEKPQPPQGQPAPETWCKVGTDASGQDCKVCGDNTGKIIYDGCSAPTPPAPPASGECKVSKDASGQECKVCFDANGKITYDGCSAPTPPPSCAPPPSTGKCADVPSDDPAVKYCTVCWDATGAEIKRSCVRSK
jgi:hypothetical protein